MYFKRVFERVFRQNKVTSLYTLAVTKMIRKYLKFKDVIGQYYIIYACENNIFYAAKKII